MIHTIRELFYCADSCQKISAFLLDILNWRADLQLVADGHTLFIASTYGDDRGSKVQFYGFEIQFSGIPIDNLQFVLFEKQILVPLYTDRDTIFHLH